MKKYTMLIVFIWLVGLACVIKSAVNFINEHNETQDQKSVLHASRMDNGNLYINIAPEGSNKAWGHIILTPEQWIDFMNQVKELEGKK